MSQDWDEVEALRASLREHMAEIKRLNECLTWEQHRAEHVGTHGPGCAMWGPKHYECLLRAYNAMKERTSQESRQVEPVAWLIESYDSYAKRTLQRLVFDNPKNMQGVKITAYYTAPPERKPLTDEEIDALRQSAQNLNFVTLREFKVIARAIERAHGIGGEK